MISGNSCSALNAHITHGQLYTLFGCVGGDAHRTALGAMGGKFVAAGICSNVGRVDRVRVLVSRETTISKIIQKLE
jgi:hypothetical protein